LNKTAENRIQLNTIQKLAAERMLYSKQTKPCCYIEAKADVTELISLRPALRKLLGVKITTNSFYIKAIALAVRQYPLMIAKLNGDFLDVADSINVGFAVSAPQGLVVPVIRNADKKTLKDIAVEEKVLTEKARSNKLTLEDIEQETIALSNLGSFDIDSFIAIPPPQTSAILAAGNTLNTIVPKDGLITNRKMVSFCLAVDNRIINEIYAAGFLKCLINHLENPNELI